MEDILRLIPGSIINLVGMAVLIYVLIILGTLAQKSGEKLYRWLQGNKEKRREQRPDYDGIERRQRTNLEDSISSLIDSLAMFNQAEAGKSEEFRDFISTWKKSHFELKDNVDALRRTQAKNAERLFDEELPAIHRIIHQSKSA